MPEGKDTADALQTVLDTLSAQTIVVISGDTVTDLPLQVAGPQHLRIGSDCLSSPAKLRSPVLQGIIGAHYTSDASVTVLCTHSSRVAEPKPGKPPKDVDFVGEPHALPTYTYPVSTAAAVVAEASARPGNPRETSKRSVGRHGMQMQGSQSSSRALCSLPDRRQPATCPPPVLVLEHAGGALTGTLWLPGTQAQAILVCVTVPPQLAQNQAASSAPVLVAGWEEPTGRLLLLDSCQEPKRGLHVPAAALNSSPHLTIHTGLADAHLYLLQKQAVQDALAQRPALASIRHVSSLEWLLFRRRWCLEAGTCE